MTGKKGKTIVSEAIRERIMRDGGSCLANDNIAAYLEPGELDALQQEVEERVKDLLASLVIDTEHDHNTRETAQRIARMYVREVFAGRYVSRPKITEFPNVKKLDQIYTLGPITVRSACSHHLVPIIGQCWVGVIPSDRVIGISKFARLAEWIFARPQIQEEATVQLADELEALIRPLGLAVIVKARHECMSWRGVREPECAMTTSVMRGYFRTNTATRVEFLSLIKDI